MREALFLINLVASLEKLEKKALILCVSHLKLIKIQQAMQPTTYQDKIV